MTCARPGRFDRARKGTDPVGSTDPANRKESAMLWTILIILVIIAVVLFILGRVRGGGRSL
jgi:uncharacterized integral membrane protein